jgi:integrase
LAVFKRLICKSCKSQEQAAKEAIKPPPCPKCGGERKYSEKWYVSLLLGGEKYVKAVSNQKSVAATHMANMLSDRDAGVLKAKPRYLTFEDAAKNFLIWCDLEGVKGNLSPNSVKLYRNRVNSSLLPFFKEMNIEAIDYSVLDSFMAHQMTKSTRNRGGEETGKKLSRDSINKDLTLVKQVLQLAIRQGNLRISGATGYKGMRGNNKRERFLSKEEIAKMMNSNLRPEMRTALIVGLNTGLRVDGIMTLRFHLGSLDIPSL